MPGWLFISAVKNNPKTEGVRTPGGYCLWPGLWTDWAQPCGLCLGVSSAATGRGQLAYTHLKAPLGRHPKWPIYLAGSQSVHEKRGE